MKKITDKEVMKLVQDINKAKVEVFNKYGFTIDEISRMTGVPEFVIKQLLIIKSINDKESE